MGNAFWLILFCSQYNWKEKRVKKNIKRLKFLYFSDLVLLKSSDKKCFIITGKKGLETNERLLFSVQPRNYKLYKILSKPFWWKILNFSLLLQNVVYFARVYVCACQKCWDLNIPLAWRARYLHRKIDIWQNACLANRPCIAVCRSVPVLVVGGQAALLSV